MVHIGSLFVLVEAFIKEDGTKPEEAIHKPYDADETDHKPPMGDDGGRVAERSSDGDEPVEGEEANVLETAAEEEARDAPARVEDGFVDDSALLDNVGGVDEDGNRQAYTAEEKVNNAEALNADVGDGVQATVQSGIMEQVEQWKKYDYLGT